MGRDEVAALGFAPPLSSLDAGDVFPGALARD
jgi:hypothetical protein